MIRRQLALDLGLVLPTVRVRDNLQHAPNAYVVKLRGVEIARASLARQISRQYADDADTVHVITVGPRTEEEIAASVQQSDRGSTIAMAPWQMQRLLGVVSTEVERVASSGRDPIILCSSRIRLALRRLLERRLPNVTVLSFAEITPQTSVEAMGNIEVNVGNETIHR